MKTFKTEQIIRLKAGSTLASGEVTTEDRLLLVPDEYAHIDLNALPDAGYQAIVSTFQRVFVDPATLSTQCATVITPPVVTPPVVSDLYALAQLTATGIIFRAGPDEDMTIRLVTYPAGYENFSQTYPMSRSVDAGWASLGGKTTYRVKAYDQAPAGRYVALIIKSGKKYYAAIVRQAAQANQEVVLTFSDEPPPAGAMLGDISWVVGTDRKATGTVVASSAVEITPPRLQGAAATAYVDMLAAGDSYSFVTGVLTPGDYVGSYRRKGDSTVKSYGFTVAKTTILAIDRTDLDSGGRAEFTAKLSYTDGLQYRLSFNGGTVSAWYAIDQTSADAQGYRYVMTVQALTPGDQISLEFRPAQNPAAVVPYQFTAGSANVARRTVYPNSSSAARQRTPVGSYSGFGQNGEVAPAKAGFTAAFNRYDSATGLYYVNYGMSEAAGSGYEWRLFMKDKFYTLADASQSGMACFRSNIVNLYRVNPATDSKTWRDQTVPGFDKDTASTSYN